MQKKLNPGSVMLNDIAQNKTFAMLQYAMMDNYQSTAVAGRYDNIEDYDEFDFMDNNDTENMDNGDASVVEDESIINIDADEICIDCTMHLQIHSCC